MKRSVLILFALMLCMTGLCAQAEDGMRQITVKEWLDAKGTAGDCILEMEVLEVLNPVLAVAGDETGSVNIFGLNMYGNFFGFGENGFQAGDRITVRNPEYNMFENSVEMKNAELLTFSIGDTPRVSLKNWLDSKGSENGNLYVMVTEVLNPVLAAVMDETGNANLFLLKENGEERSMDDCGIQVMNILILGYPEYNEFEGNVEMAKPELIRRIAALQAE
ncbi:MAG: hypothetical protein Q4G19_03010 [Clostridia bacterium]|nr:hypothetical protein [Clostridia bacterium]